MMMVYIYINVQYIILFKIQKFKIKSQLIFKNAKFTKKNSCNQFGIKIDWY